MAYQEKFCFVKSVSFLIKHLIKPKNLNTQLKVKKKLLLSTKMEFQIHGNIQG